MSDLIHRSQAAQRCLEDASLPASERLWQALAAFSGLNLWDIPAEVRAQLEADFASVNEVLARYHLEEEEDYESISDADLRQMLGMVHTAARRAITAELDRIVGELDAGMDKLPVAAIKETREHRDLMVPKLIEVLRDVTSAARAGDVRQGNAHFFAIFLLTEFQAEESFPVILEAFSLPGRLPFALFGGAVTTTLARILAQFAADRPEVMDSLIRNPDLNQYVRWQAAECYVHLVRDKHLTREQAIERLRQHLLWAVAEQDEAVIGGLIGVLVSFAPQEALEDIKEAYRLNLVDERVVELETAESWSAAGEDHVREQLELCPETGIRDTAEELRRWAVFAEQPARRPAPPRPRLSAAGRKPIEPVAGPASSRGPRVGRNDPCPCGSGKKWKKCCGFRG